MFSCFICGLIWSLRERLSLVELMSGLNLTHLPRNRDLLVMVYKVGSIHGLEGVISGGKSVIVS
jgi:hypothetical protein